MVEEYLAQGLSPREIALLLDISTQAVYEHRQLSERDRAERSSEAS